MNPALPALYRVIFNSLESAFEELAKFQKSIGTQEGSTIPELTDGIYGLKSIRTLLEEKIAILNRIEDKLIQYVTHITEVETVRTTWVTATYKPQNFIPIPKKGTEEWIAICKWLGLPEDAPIKFSFGELEKILAERMGNGENCPIDPTKLITIYKVTCRGKKDLLSGQPISKEKDIV